MIWQKNISFSTKSDKAQKRISNVSSSLFSDKQSRIYVVVPGPFLKNKKNSLIITRKLSPEKVMNKLEFYVIYSDS